MQEETNRNGNFEKNDESVNPSWEAFEPLIIQDRDIQVMKMIHEQRFLAHSHIKQAFWRDRSDQANTCYHRLARLKEEGYLRQVYSSRKNLHLYLITEKALDELKKQGLDSGIRLYLPGEFWQRSVDHDLKVSTIRILFREFGFDSWTSERVLREQNVPFRIPDGILNVAEYKLAVEFENYLSKSRRNFTELFDNYRTSGIYHVVFIVLYGDIKDWLLDLDYDPEQVFFANYKDLLWRREKTRFENRSRVFAFEELL